MVAPLNLSMESPFLPVDIFLDRSLFRGKATNGAIRSTVTVPICSPSSRDPGSTNSSKQLLTADRRQEFLLRLCSALEGKIERNRAGTAAQQDQAIAHEQEPSAFQGRTCPKISLQDYIARLSKHTKCSSVCFVIACTYIEKLLQVNEKYRLCKRNVHRMLLCGVTIAAKLMDDKFHSNAYYSRVGGISNKELNRLEIEMMSALEFRTYVSKETILQHLRSMITDSRWEPGQLASVERMPECRASEDSRQSGKAEAPGHVLYELQHRGKLVNKPTIKGQDLVGRPQRQPSRQKTLPLPLSSARLMTFTRRDSSPAVIGITRAEKLARSSQIAVPVGSV